MEAATDRQWEEYVSLVEQLVEKHQAGAAKTDVDGNPPLTAATWTREMFPAAASSQSIAPCEAGVFISHKRTTGGRAAHLLKARPCLQLLLCFATSQDAV